MNKIKLKQIEDITSNNINLVNDLDITDPVGRIKTTTKDYEGHSIANHGYYRIPAEKIIEESGQEKLVKTSIEAALNEILSEEKQPSVVQPTAVITTAERSVEIGTITNINVNNATSAGSYSYGPATGVTFDDETAALLLADDNYNVIETKVGGVLNKVTLFTDIACNTQTVYGTLEVHHSEGTIPVTNKGNQVPSKQIQSRFIATERKKQIITFRAYFYGFTNITPTYVLDSNIVRNTMGLTKSISGITNTVPNITVPTDTSKKYLVLAFPTNANKTINTAVAQTPGGPEQPITERFVKKTETVNVEGANGFTPISYDVWYYIPDVVQANDIYKITLKNK